MEKTKFCFTNAFVGIFSFFNPGSIVVGNPSFHNPYKV